MVDAYDTRELLRRAPVSARALIGVNASTWSRWRRGESRTPAAVVALLRFMVAGQLPHGADDWDGWRFYDGKLYDPEGTAHTPGSIQAWHWTRQELQAWRTRENVALPEDLPENVKPLPNRQRAAELTKETHRRINQKSDK